jgi:hypothetical protein
MAPILARGQKSSFKLKNGVQKKVLKIQKWASLGPKI